MFFPDKKAICEYNVRNFRLFLFGMSPDVPARHSKCAFLQVTLNSELE